MLRFFPQRHGKYVCYFYTINAMKGSMCLIWQCKGCKKILLVVLEYQAQLLRPLFAVQYEDCKNQHKSELTWTASIVIVTIHV